MRIIGIDPGIAIVGYGIIDIVGNGFSVVDYGIIETPSTMDELERLKSIYDSMNILIDRYNPQEAAIEELFFNKNIKTAIQVAQARGVELLACMNRGLEVYEYTPLQIKQAVVGYGRAEKKQIQEMVKMLLNLKSIPKPDDAADGLAIAITHAHSRKHKEMFRVK
ncbi:crossover junction endodeoxyribonuclease RuvC [Peptoniphilus sp. KCTC 25270]|uniref:crossover junction endodeoxyribonuclease RuvC n=1 Tax=Peptoniphilus sp. KCTC 25270 TaxID=2897414 RepID=UPI001E5F3CB2|nr:crossover junction endodeoxyribonuclease RuvC [Peptoniphilus sp. KCTC 25270]MCD1147048.1 crossover junction endodeoxyribonuclease RuvC [Peptoniphilus sp. KCTC 25270]